MIKTTKATAIMDALFLNLPGTSLIFQEQLSPLTLFYFATPAVAFLVLLNYGYYIITITQLCYSKTNEFSNESPFTPQEL